MSQCFHPFFVDAPSGSKNEKHPVPCGKCPPCLQRRASSWGFRLYSELRSQPCCYFLTLTYSIPPISTKGFMTLVKRDWQLFMKRLRKSHKKGTVIRYYAVGEYGSIRFRPHFHAIIYGIDPTLVLSCWQPSDVTYAGSPGILQLDSDVNLANIAYVCKYITKGRRIPSHSNDDRLPEFSLMSKNLGLSYLTPQIIRYHKADLSRNYLTLNGGVKIALPRYYKDRIYSLEEREFMFFQNQDQFNVRFQKELAECIQRKSEREFYDDIHYAIAQSEALFFNTSALKRKDI